MNKNFCSFAFFINSNTLSYAELYIHLCSIHYICLVNYIIDLNRTLKTINKTIDTESLLPI